MNCFFVTNHLTAFQEGELTDEQRQEVEKHLEECASCSRNLFELNQTRQILRQFPQMHVDAHLRSRIRLVLTKEKLARPWYRHALLSPNLVLTGLFSFMLLLGWLGLKVWSPVLPRTEVAAYVEPEKSDVIVEPTPLVEVSPSPVAQASPTPVAILVPQVKPSPLVQAEARPKEENLAVRELHKTLTVEESQDAWEPIEMQIVQACERLACKSLDATAQLVFEQQAQKHALSFQMPGKNYLPMISKLKVLGALSGSLVDPKQVAQEAAIIMHLQLVQTEENL